MAEDYLKISRSCAQLNYVRVAPELILESSSKHAHPKDCVEALDGPISMSNFATVYIDIRE